MSVAPLLEQLRRDAANEVTRRLEAARADATNLLAEADAEQARELDLALAERERSLGLELDRRRDELLRRCHLEELESRRRLVQRSLGTARARIPLLAGRPDFAPALQRLIKRALEFLPTGECLLVCHPAIEATVRLAAQADGIAPERVRVDNALDFGFTVESTDHGVRVDATLATLMARSEDELAIRVVRRHMEQTQ